MADATLDNNNILGSPQIDTDPPHPFVGYLGIDWDTVTASPAFKPGLIAFFGIFFCFFKLLWHLPKLWFAGDGYYSHGLLVPMISGYIVYKWWPKLEKTPVKPFFPAILGIIPCLMIYRGAMIVDVTQIMSLAFVGSIFFGIWFAAGGRWMMKLAIPTGYLLFMLPVFTAFIDNYTNRIQILSTKTAELLLSITGFNPILEGTSTIYLNNFTLDVGVPCSGLKLLLAVSAFTIFFMCIARLGLWGNLLMAALVVPLCLFINGLRIAMIGIVGNQFGHDAGMAFHDWSGYLSLLICFYLLFKIARLLGWKD